jgi:hypothetical protein
MCHRPFSKRRAATTCWCGALVACPSLEGGGDRVPTQCLQSHVANLRAPDFVNVAFGSTTLDGEDASAQDRFERAFNQAMSDGYISALSSQKIMQNELYNHDLQAHRVRQRLAEIYRHEETAGRAGTGGWPDPELAGNVEAVRDYAPSRGMLRPATASCSPRRSNSPAIC